MAPFGNVLKILFILFVMYVIFEIIRKIFGGSLGFQDLVIVLLVANLGYSFKLSSMISKVDSKISGHLGWHKGRENHVK